MAGLMKLRQHRNVAEYHEEFDAIVSRLNLSEEYTLSCFLGGLKHEVQMLVRMFQPQSVRKAFSLAKMYEATYHDDTPATSVNRKAKILGTQKPLLANKPSSNANEPSEADKTKFRPLRRLTPAYMNEQRAQGLCYFCDKPYTPKHGLSHKNIHIHVMEIDDQDTPIDNALDEDSSSQLQSDLMISVHVLTGMANFKTMRVIGYHRK